MRKPQERPRYRQSDCSEDQLFYVALRIDESQYFAGTVGGDKLLKKYGKIYGIYVWSPDVAVHIASLQRSAEMWLVDYVPQKLYSGKDAWKQEKAYDAWEEVKNDLMHDANLVDYMDYNQVERLAKDKKNVSELGCFDKSEDKERDKSAEDAVEYYQSNPAW